MNLPTFVGAKLAARLRRIPGVKVWVKAPLAPFTTIGTGGSAELLVSVGSTQALTAVLRELQTDGVPWICLGVGSNVLVADRGYAGVVIKLDENFHYVEGLTPLHPHDDSRSSGTEGNKVREEPVCLVVGAGAFLARLAAVAAEAGLSGLEFACGIPGSVGGAVVMNAGAHGRAFADVVEAVELTSAVGPTWVERGQLVWRYRSCLLPPDSVVTAVRLRLLPADPASVLKEHRALLRQRRTTQPRGVRTFGSVFKNPPGQHAGRLLEAAGVKGVRRGGAEVSIVHANFIINLGDATSGDVLALMGLMRQAVYRTSGVMLEPEVKLLGASFPWEESPAVCDAARADGDRS